MRLVSVLVSSYKAFDFLFNNTWQSDEQFFFWGKALIILKTVTSAQLSGKKKHNGFENHSEVFIR